MALSGATLRGARGSCACTTLVGSHRQPRAVYKYWAQVRLCGDAATHSETGTHSVKLYVVVDTPVMAQMRIPMALEILQLQYIDKMVDLCCAGPSSLGSGREETVEIPQLQLVSWTWSFTRPLCATTDANGRCPHAVHHVPVIMQLRCTGEVPQIQFSPATVDVPVVQQRRGIFSSTGDGGDEGLLTHFASFFALLRLSRS